jgi:uncharacterized protein (TIGR02145 family)
MIKNQCEMKKIKLLAALILFNTLVTSLSAQFVSDIDGNRYPVIIIKKQSWMGENLKTTRFNDGKTIPYVKSDKAWKAMETPAYCWLYNDTVNRDVYGALYNWYAVNTKKLCPTGWHVPSKSEWEELATATGDEENAGAKLKEEGYEHWKNNIVISTNEFGFSALPAGKRLMEGNFPDDANNYGVWWTSTEFNKIAAWNPGVYYRTSKFYCGGDNKKNGFSVRCLKN